MRRFLTCSDGSLTLPVRFREMYDSKQTGLIHFHFSTFWSSVNEIEALGKCPSITARHSPQKLQNKYNMKT